MLSLETKERNGMSERATATAENTAVRVALWRALHVQADPPGIEMAAKGARASGTPFISFFMPDQMLEMGRAAGFKSVQHMSAADLAERYFSGRSDGLRPPNNSEELLVATT